MPPRIIVIFISFNMLFCPSLVPLPDTDFPLYPVTDLPTFGNTPSSERVLHSNFRSYMLEIRDFYSSQYGLPERLVNLYSVYEEIRFTHLKQHFMHSKTFFFFSDKKVRMIRWRLKWMLKVIWYLTGINVETKQESWLLFPIHAKYLHVFDLYQMLHKIAI